MGHIAHKILAKGASRFPLAIYASAKQTRVLTQSFISIDSPYKEVTRMGTDTHEPSGPAARPLGAMSFLKGLLAPDRDLQATHPGEESWV